MASDYYRVTDTETRLRSVGHSIGLVVAAFLVGIALSALTAQALALAGYVEPPLEEAPAPALAAISAMQFVGFGVAVYAYLAWRDDPDLFDVGVPSLRDLGYAVGGFIALFVVALGISAVIQALGAETATNQVVEQGENNPTLFLYMIPVTILFVAPAEEFLFRGVVQGLLRRAYGIVPGVLLASLFFGVAHYLALTGGGKLTYIAVAAGLGLVLGAAYEFSENLTVPILMHGVWNAFLFGSQYLVASGAVQA